MGHIRDYSEETAADIDKEIRRLVSDAYETTTNILSAHMAQLDVVAKELIEKEKLDGDAFRALMTGTALPKESGEEPFSGEEE